MTFPRFQKKSFSSLSQIKINFCIKNISIYIKCKTKWWIGRHFMSTRILLIFFLCRVVNESSYYSIACNAMSCYYIECFVLSYFKVYILVFPTSVYNQIWCGDSKCIIQTHVIWFFQKKNYTIFLDLIIYFPSYNERLINMNALHCIIEDGIHFIKWIFFEILFYVSHQSLVNRRNWSRSSFNDSHMDTNQQKKKLFGASKTHFLFLMY